MNDIQVSKSNALVKDVPAWGEAEESRGMGQHQSGKSYHQIALLFAKAFQIGAELTPEIFDTWAHQNGYLNAPENAPKKSDVWLAHLQRRHQLRYNINQAATHPRMYESGAVAFTIDAVGPAKWEVRAPQIAVTKEDLPGRILSLTKTKRKRLRYLMQSADWNALPPHERLLAETLFDDITRFEQLVDLECNGLSAKFFKLESKLRKAMEVGEIKSANGGIRGFIEPQKEV